MAATSASTYAAVGPRPRWPMVLLAAVITWCVGVVLTPLALYLWVRLKWPMLPELHEFVSPSHTYLGLWGLNCGIAAVGALLLLRRNSLAVWPIAVLAILGPLNELPFSRGPRPGRLPAGSAPRRGPSAARAG